MVEAESLLAVDVGASTTRATLFDVVEGYYRFIASGQAMTTASAPFKNVGEGVRQAIENLQTITGRRFLDADLQLIVPYQEGSGVDAFAATISAGPTLKTAVVGLLLDISFKSAHRLARTIYSRVVDTIGMNDRRKPEEQIDSLLHLRPDLILIAGGTDGGATRAMQKLLETIGLACYLLPADKRPAVLFVGNQKLAAEVKASLQSLTSSLTIGSNLRPTLEIEDLLPAQRSLADLYATIRRSQIGGVEELNAWAGGNLMPTAYAQGRIIRFLSQVYDSRKGILGIDIGASAATVAAAFGGELTLGVYPQFGLGEGLAGLLGYTKIEDILRWLALDIPADVVQDYLHQKSLYPTSLPATAEDLVLEQALTRQALYLALNATSKDFSHHTQWLVPGMTPFFEPILAAGSAITNAPTLGQSLMILLDAIQPVGVTTLILDQNNLLPALGAAANLNSILPIQVLESGAFLGLASVVAPVVSAQPGTPILRVRLVNKNGNEIRLEVKQGALEVLPLPSGQSGRLFLEPLHRADVGFGAGRGGNMTVSGTALGVVIDARGRPLRFPADHGQRRELLKKWLWTVGG
ncbi:MAG: glutamate mutase L [Chloroflexi bacterium]|nr:glutamate mutase L [Chloroflexota bacterium]